MVALVEDRDNQYKYPIQVFLIKRVTKKSIRLIHHPRARITFIPQA